MLAILSTTLSLVTGPALPACRSAAVAPMRSTADVQMFNLFGNTGARHIPKALKWASQHQPAESDATANDAPALYHASDPTLACRG